MSSSDSENINEHSEQDEEKTTGTLLCVDDEEPILRSLQRLFMPEGYKVLIATSGADALEILEKESVDIILSDMRMPEMNGATFLRKASENWPTIKRVLLTGYADIELAISAINDGRIDYYLNKPWKEDQLQGTIRHLLESKHLKDENKILTETIQKQNKQLVSLNGELQEKVLERTAKLKQAYDVLRSTHQSTLEVLSTLVEMSEGENKGTCRQIAKIAKYTAEAMDLPSEAIHDIYFASVLHHIGRIGMPIEMLTSAFTSLSLEQQKQFKKYPLLGEASLMAFASLKNVAAIIGAHRERFDGSGYPHQLEGEEIPLGARIVSVAVDYSELQLGLLIDESLTARQALEYIQKNENQRYDPAVISAFTQVLSWLPEQKKLLKEVILSPENLSEGMVLARDLVSESGILLLPGGERLTQHNIDKIKSLESLVVYIESDE